jgi:hypothetical protein
MEGHRFQVFICDSTDPDFSYLEARHRGHARVEDRIGNAKQTGLDYFPCHDFDDNQAWLTAVLMACDLLAWTQQLAGVGPLATSEPKRLRYCHRRAHRHHRPANLSAPPSQLALGRRPGRRVHPLREPPTTDLTPQGGTRPHSPQSPHRNADPKLHSPDASMAAAPIPPQPLKPTPATVPTDALQRPCQAQRNPAFRGKFPGQQGFEMMRDVLSRTSLGGWDDHEIV